MFLRPRTPASPPASNRNALGPIRHSLGMSNGDDEADASDDAEATDEIDVTAEELESRLTRPATR